METKGVSELAKLLRECGDKILNSECKLTLSESLLKEVNNSFVLLNDQKDTMSSSFQVINSSNIRTDYFRDIQFLHDFLQRTSSLKIVSEDSDQTVNNLDITIFKNIRLFELYKVNVNKIKGIQALRAQIQFLVCRWILNTLSEILEKCGYDDCKQAFIWSELKEASFSHNNLSYLDSSLEFVPWLNTIDLSHNCIKDARPLSCLSNLKHLNLSYNQLESIPCFSGQICSRLQVLIINNNYVDNIGNIINLVNLQELDLSNNCLIDHPSLLPLTYLAALQWLSLEGNPLSFHPQHRIKTVCYLNANTATVRFLFDHKLLTKSESKICGKIQPVYHNRQHMESTSSTVSNVTLMAAERPRRVRAATISDGIEASEMDTSIASVASLMTSNDHLETKRTIEQLREQYGEKWLHCQAGSLVQDVLGHEKSFPISSSPYDTLLSSFDINESHQNNNGGELKSEESMNGTETYTTASETTGNDDGPYANTAQNVLPNSATDDDEDDDEDVLGEGEESLYLVTPKDNPEPVFLVVTNSHIWERDCSSGKERTRWSLDSLLSCCTSGTDTVCLALEFDTVKRDKQKREYELDNEDAEKLSKLLNDRLSTSELQKSRVVIFKCMKCGTKFGEEKKLQVLGKEGVRICPTPTCNSTLVIEDDE